MTEPSLPNCPRCHAPVAAGTGSCPACGYAIEVDVSRAAAGNLDVVAWITEGWRMFLPNAAAFVGFGTVAVIASIATMMASEQIPLIGWLLPTVVSAPLFAGFLTAALKLRRGEVLEFGDFLRGFDYIVPLVLGTLVSNVLVTVGFILLILPGIYLMVGYTFMTPLIVDGRLDFWQAMEGSRRVVHEHWMNFFTFAGALFLVNLAGILVFGVGLLVSMPVTYCAVVVAYDQVFGLRRA
jgi:uncharacterized membrane protein